MASKTAEKRGNNQRRLVRRSKGQVRREPAREAPSQKEGAPNPDQRGPDRAPAPGNGERARRRPPQQVPHKRPANENEPTTAALISRLKRKPSSVPFWMAALGSLLWVFAFAYFLSTYLASSDIVAKLVERPAPELAGIAILGVLPIFLMFAIAYIYRRGQQMSHVSEALVQTALRLVRPEEMAVEGVSTVGKAVRREVKFGDQNHRFLQIKEGLDDGDAVIISSYAPFGQASEIALQRRAYRPGSNLR